jgi:hypothetical protein
MSESKKLLVEVLPFEEFASKPVEVLNGSIPAADSEGIVKGLVLLSPEALVDATDLQVGQRIAEALYGVYDSDVWVVHKPFGTAVDRRGIVYSFELGRWSQTLAFDEL